MAKKTFDFGTNPINQFISGPALSIASTPAVVRTEPRSPRAGKKDKWICVMIQSSLYEDLSKIARVKGISKNEVFAGLQRNIGTMKEGHWTGTRLFLRNNRMGSQY